MKYTLTIWDLRSPRIRGLCLTADQPGLKPCVSWQHSLLLGKQFQLAQGHVWASPGVITQQCAEPKSPQELKNSYSASHWLHNPLHKDRKQNQVLPQIQHHIWPDLLAGLKAVWAFSWQSGYLKLHEYLIITGIPNLPSRVTFPVFSLFNTVLVPWASLKLQILEL